MGNEEFFLKTEEKYEIVDGKKEIASETIKTLRVSDSLPVVILTKVSNYGNDARMQYLTHLTKEDGLQDYLLDSIYYDKFGNDTLKRSYVCIGKNWQPAQISRKQFRPDKQVNHLMTERPFKQNSYFRKEIFYSYNDNGKIISETELECTEKTVCDSTFKINYLYNLSGNNDSTVSYIWKNNEWIEFKKKTADNIDFK
jgi:hypothetical protein